MDTKVTVVYIKPVQVGKPSVTQFIVLSYQPCEIQLTQGPPMAYMIHFRWSTTWMWFVLKMFKL